MAQSIRKLLGYGSATPIGGSAWFQDCPALQAEPLYESPSGAIYLRSGHVIVGEETTYPEAFESFGGPSDQVEWQISSLIGGGQPWNSIAYGSDRFVAISGKAGSYLASYIVNGSQSWVASSLPSPTSGFWQSIAYGGGVFVVVANNSSNAAYSVDGGVTWLSAELPFSAHWSSVAYGNGAFIAVSTNKKNFARSVDGGATWVEIQSIPISRTWRSITYGGGAFVVVAGDFGSVARSTDGGITWIQNDDVIANSSWNSVAYGDGVLIAVDKKASGNIAVSADGGVTWSYVQNPANLAMSSVTYGGGVWVAVPQGGLAICSVNGGASWETSQTPYLTNYTSIAYGDGKFIATGANSSSGDIATPLRAVGIPDQRTIANGDAILYQRIK